MNIEDNKKIIALTLSKMKKEQDKKSTIYMEGVDLSNYQNGFYEALMDTVLYIIGKNEKTVRECIEWWLFEDGDHVFINDVKVCIKDANSFSDFLFSLEL